MDRNNNDSLKLAYNCKIENECRLGHKCNLDSIVYQVNISAKENDNSDKAYIGIDRGLKWIFRYYNHLQSFRNPTLRNQTALSWYYWDLRELGLIPVINWKIIKISFSTNSLNGKCNLCLEKKTFILKYFNKNLFFF